MEISWNSILDNLDLVLMLATSTIFLLYLGIAEGLAAAKIRKVSINYPALTTITLLTATACGGIAVMRARLDTYADVDRFSYELSATANNDFASRKVKQWRPQLQDLKEGQVNTGTTSETVEDLVRAFGECTRGMQVSVINPQSLSALDGASDIWEAEETAIARGVRVVHLIVGSGDEENVGSGPTGKIATISEKVEVHRIDYASTNQMDSFRRYGAGTLFSFGDEWFCEVSVVSSGRGSSLKGRFLWGKLATPYIEVFKELKAAPAEKAST